MVVWGSFFVDLDVWGFRWFEFVIVDGVFGFEVVFVVFWGGDLFIQCCMVYKYCNLFGYVFKCLYDELSEDYCDMIYVDSVVEIEMCCKVFFCKWKFKCWVVVDSFEEVGDCFFSFICFDLL